MRNHAARYTGAFVSMILLAGCGGGGSDGPGAVALKTKADVIREVANVSTLYADGSGAAAAGRQAGLKRLATNARTAHARMARAKSASATPKVAVTEDCHSGSYTYEEFFETARNLPLFAVNPVVDYYVETDRDCRFTEGTYSEFYDGHFEFGDNAAYTEGTVEAPYHDYGVDGSGGTPFRQVIEDTSFDEKFTIKTLGRYEGRDNGLSFESRENFDIDLTYQFGGEGFNVGARSGESGNPLIFVDNYGGDGSVSIDGPITYDTDFCDSGRVEYDTVQNLTFGFSDTYGNFINGGELLIESGSASVTLVFQNDGGITYTFDDGATGTVTLDELNNAEECLFTP